MLTPEYLQGAPVELEKLYLKLEEEIISDICRRIAKAGYITDTAEYQILRLKELGAGTEYIKQKIKEYSGLSDTLCDRLFFDAAQISDEFYSDLYSRAHVEYTPYEYNAFFQQTVDANVNQTKGELRNMTGSMGFSYRGSDGQRRFHPAAEAYRDCLDYAFMQVESGMVDYTTAVRNATRRLTDSGLQFVDYESGVVNHVDVAVRRAVLTGISQVTGQIAEHNMQELGTDIVEVDAHSGARPDHKLWQGKRFSFSGTSSEYPSLRAVTGYGTVTGLKGANCRHDFYPVIVGISEPMYTEEELANIDPPPFSYKGKEYTAYEAEQRQRYMERAMRKTKREILAAEQSGDEDMFTAKSVLLRRQREEYKNFSKAAGLLTQNERTQVYGFGRSQASKASWAERKANARNSKFSQLLSEYNNGQKDTIQFRNIEKNLNKSSIGKEILHYLELNPVEIQIYYNVDVPKELLGIQDPFDDVIKIFASNTKTVQRTTETIIHEVTHRRFDIGGDYHSECVCRAQEYKHRYRKNSLTISELRVIIKEIKRDYSDSNFKWRCSNG